MLFLGIDVGTSGCKALLLDDTGSIRSSATEGYPLSHPRNGWFEQDPAHWWAAACRASRRAMAEAAAAPEAVACIGLSAQMHGLVALDAAQRVIRPAILWNDVRSAPQCEEILTHAGGLDGLLSMTNNNMIPGYTASKLLWLRENEPEQYARMRWMLNPKDYIRLLMTGDIATDVSDASGTGLFDVRRRRWSDALIDLLAFPREIFPRAFESTEITGRLSAQAAEALGLLSGTAVCGGGGDAVIQTTGSGLLEAGTLATITGTAGIVAAGLGDYVENAGGELQMFCNNAPGLWHMMGVSLCAGEAQKWLKKLVLHECPADREPYALLNAWAGESVPGSRRMLFLPQLCGERCPYNDASARGAFLGLEHSHTVADMTRAVMEGVMFNLRQIAEKIPIRAQEIRASGGGTQSPEWVQIQADVFGLPVVCLEGAEEGGAFGAALVAGIAIGSWQTTLDAMRTLKVKTRIEPRRQYGALYDELFGIYKQAYPALKHIHEQLANEKGEEAV